MADDSLDDIARVLARGPELAPILENLGRCPRGERWLTLLDALRGCGAAVAVDWREEWEDVEPALDHLVARVLDDQNIPWPDELGEVETGEALTGAAAALAGTGYALVNLHDGTDTFTVAVVPEATIAQLVRAAQTAGEEISQTFR